MNRPKTVEEVIGISKQKWEWTSTRDVDSLPTNAQTLYRDVSIHDTSSRRVLSIDLIVPVRPSILSEALVSR